MNLLNTTLGIYTDMYELTMLETYFHTNKTEIHSAFDYSFRKIPFNGGYVIFSGLSELLDAIVDIKFSSSDIDFLHSKNMSDDFLEYLKTFSFNGKINSVEEGTIVFPNEHVLNVEGKLSEVQLLETMLLNILNFNSLISTKAARMRSIIGDRMLVDFGLRRAQGFGGVQASKAAIIGGFNSTSNVYAGKYFDLQISGTMAHSLIQSFDDELTAFRKFAEIHPNNCIFLVDTYNTLKSGIPNAIIVGKELEKRGYKLKGIRLDSGDLAYLSSQARKMLDDAGLNYVKIVVSNQLDEIIIKSLLEQKAPIDIFGVGTSLSTGYPDGALDGVYKMCVSDDKPTIKLSENIQKMNLPGIKKLIRYTDSDGYYQADGILLQDEENVSVIFHPLNPEKFLSVHEFNSVQLTQTVFENGKKLISDFNANELREKVIHNLHHLPVEYKRFEFPHIYKVGLSEKLMTLRDELRIKNHHK